MSRPLRALIDARAIASNVAAIRRRANGPTVIATVKADAFGHGLELAVPAMHDADGFAVAFVEEGASLRSIAPDKTIIVLEGIFDERELRVASELDLQIVVHNDDQVRLVEESSLLRFRIWLKVDTGMHRLGFQGSQSMRVAARLAEAGNSVLVGLLTHLASADDLEDYTTTVQMDRMGTIAAEFAIVRHLAVSVANSAAILAWPAVRGDFVRPGIMLYGASPFPGRIGAEFDLQPAMTLISSLISIQYCTKGEGVGYGGDWICPSDMAVGIVAAGYADGYPRHARPGTPVLVNGEPATILGRVSMDMLFVDLRGHTAKVGDPVTLWGRGLPVETIAKCASTVPNDLLAGLSQRVPRVPST